MSAGGLFWVDTDCYEFFHPQMDTDGHRFFVRRWTGGGEQRLRCDEIADNYQKQG